MNLFKNLILIAAIASCIAFAQADVFFTEQGYPYGDLVKRSDSVKIYYTEEAQKINCRVTVQKGDQSWQTAMRSVDKRHFQQKPLQYCMARDPAKEILKKVFYVK